MCGPTCMCGKTCVCMNEHVLTWVCVYIWHSALLGFVVLCLDGSHSPHHNATNVSLWDFLRRSCFLSSAAHLVNMSVAVQGCPAIYCRSRIRKPEAYSSASGWMDRTNSLVFPNPFVRTAKTDFVLAIIFYLISSYYVMLITDVLFQSFSSNS